MKGSIVMKKILALFLAAIMLFALCACSKDGDPTNADSDKTTTEKAEEKEPESIDLETDTGKVKYIGIEKANEELTDSFNNPYIVIFEYTNLSDETQDGVNAFTYEYYQNAVQLNYNGSFSSRGGEQYELCSAGFTKVMNGGTVKFAQIIDLTDESPVTVIVKEKGVSDGKSQTMVIDLKNPDDTDNDEAETTDGPETSATNSTDNLTIEKIYVDNSYTDEDNPSLKMVYVFFNVTATDENLKTDSVYTDLIINGTNTYSSDRYVTEAEDFMPSYYSGKYIKDVYVGESLKVVATFQIPEGDLSAGREITFSDTQITDFNKIKCSTDDIEYFENGTDLAKKADPKGYKKELDNRSDADEETARKVKNSINGYEYTFYVNSTTYSLTFSSPNKFILYANINGVTVGGNGGKYEVKKGYVACTYDSNGTTVFIPYSFEDGEIKLETADAFDTNI